jgi:erythromycin esterase-like protein
MGLARSRVSEKSRDARAILRLAAETLPESFGDDFATHFDRFGQARLVLLGEATHGTSEFYRARTAITRRLIERHGFNIVAVEADWPDANAIDVYARDRPAVAAPREIFARFPTWMWRNEEALEFIEWLRQHNLEAAAQSRIQFRGLDIYSLGSSVAAVLDYLDRVDPAAAKDARRRYGCLSPWQEDPVAYGGAVLRGQKDPCEGEILKQLGALLENRLRYAAQDDEAFFDAAQNARIVRAAEQYYRMMYRGSVESWNLRARHMFETLKALLDHEGPSAKAVVWAHNSHIGDAAATAMGWKGEFNIGQLCRIAFSGDAVLIGFGTDRGTVAAASDWDGPLEFKSIRPARADSFEAMFRDTELPRHLCDWTTHSDTRLRSLLGDTRLERAIGVIYRPETELHSHYFEADMAEQFNAFVWFEETSAVKPLPAGRPHGAPDTYPFGV